MSRQIKIRVKLYGTIGSNYPGYEHSKGILQAIDPEMGVNALIDLLGLPAKKIGIVTINGKLATAEDSIPENAEVKFFHPLTGG